MAKVEFDNKKMWESILSYTHCHKEIMKDHLLYALNDQGLEYKNGEIVSIEPKEKQTINTVKQESPELKEFVSQIILAITDYEINKEDGFTEKQSALKHGYHIMKAARKIIANEIDVEAIKPPNYSGMPLEKEVVEYFRTGIEETIKAIRKEK
jgi:hypothetical protein